MIWLKLTREDGSDVHVDMRHVIQIVPWNRAGRTMSALLSTVPGADGTPWSTVVQEEPREILSRLARLSKDTKIEPL